MKALKHILSIAFLTLFLGCSKDEAPLVDPAFEAFLIEFEVQANARAIDISTQLAELEVNFAADNSAPAGQCITYTNGNKEIAINATNWNRLSEEGKELLLFHELGHCVLGRGHLNEKDENGRCISIMRESTSTCPINYFESSKEEYLDELFK